MRFGEISSNENLADLWTSSTADASFKHINQRETVTVKPGVGTLYRVTIDDAGGRLELFDSLTAGQNKIAEIVLTPVRTLEFDCKLSNGLTYVSSGSIRSVTLIWS